MRSLPISMDLDGAAVAIVGARRGAIAKARLLTRTPAQTTVFIDAEENASVFDGLVPRTQIRRQRVDASCLAPFRLVFVDTGRDDEDRRIASLARRSRIPVNVVDRPALSTFSMPAIVDRDPVTIAISTEGTAPSLATRLRAELEHSLPHRLGELARVAGRCRAAVSQRLPDPSARRAFWRRIFEPREISTLLAEDERVLASRLLERARLHQAQASPPGRVVLVGAGPGDPDLLTVAAARALGQADVIVYDRLVSAAVLERSRRDAERVFVGKRPGQGGETQRDIEALLIARARAGQLVVRLKGGDPFIFGRGGEEMVALQDAGIDVEVLPGITAALACAASAGVPLTHRGSASMVTLATGRDRAGELPDLAPFAGRGRTLVVYMGVGTAPRLGAELIDRGIGGDTPIAVVENGTRPEERCIAGRLDELSALVEAHAVRNPALIIIGDVAAFARPTASRQSHESAA